MFKRFLKRIGLVSNDEWWNEKINDGYIHIGPELREEIREVANRHKLTEIEVVREFLRAGFLLELIGSHGDHVLIDYSDGTMTELVLFSKKDKGQSSE